MKNKASILAVNFYKTMYKLCPSPEAEQKHLVRFAFTMKETRAKYQID